MSHGWIADNPAGDRQTPPAFYADALRLGRESADRKRVFDAQRLLGDHLPEVGDLRPRWRPGRSPRRRLHAPATSRECSRSRICWQLWLGRGADGGRGRAGRGDPAVGGGHRRHASGGRGQAHLTEE